jgi:hypothetical protein
MAAMAGMAMVVLAALVLVSASVWATVANPTLSPSEARVARAGKVVMVVSALALAALVVTVAAWSAVATLRT